MVCTKVNVDKKKYKNPSQSNYKRGLKVGCINVRGLVSNVSKRVELNHWLEMNDLDVICIQEWFVPHGKQTNSELINVGNVNSLELLNENDKDLVITGNNLIQKDDSNNFNDDFDHFEGESKMDKRYT